MKITVLNYYKVAGVKVVSRLITNLSQNDKEILRGLAGKIRELAEAPKNYEKKQLWYSHNSLDSKRPMVLAFPEGSWGELLPENELKCEDKLARAWEYSLRQRIYTAEVIKDDNAVDSYFNIAWQINRGDFGVSVDKVHGANRGSYVWQPAIRDINAEFHKLKFRNPSVDRKLTHDMVNLAEDIFGDLLSVRIRGTHWWTLGLTIEVIDLIGLENLMLFMYDDPEGLHRLMAWMRDEHLNYIGWMEKEGLLTDMNENDYTGSGGIGYTNELPQKDRVQGMPARLKDLWGFAESQETVGVSPDMFGEFIFPYQLPLLEKFGLNCYGCCEPVDKRLDYILKIPNLRRLSVSPWANENIVAERLGRNYIFSRKPNPALICVSFNEEEIRKDIRKTLSAAVNTNLEIIMKDTHTVENQPWRIEKWVQIARQEVDKFLG